MQFSPPTDLVLALIVVAHIAPQISGKLAVQTKEHHVPITILAVVYIQVRTADNVKVWVTGSFRVGYGWTFR